MDIPFSWTAFAVKSAKIFSSVPVDEPSIVVPDQPSPPADGSDNTGQVIPTATTTPDVATTTPDNTTPPADTTTPPADTTPPPAPATPDPVAATETAPTTP